MTSPERNSDMALTVRRVLLATSVLSFASGLYRLKKRQDASAVLGVTIGALSITRAIVDLKAPASPQEPEG